MNKNKLSRTAGSLCLVLFLSATSAPRTVAFAAAEPVATTADQQEFTPPRPTRSPRPDYPEGEVGSGKEGWVHLDFMIDPRGRPYEIVVTDSMGGTPFETSAIAAVEKSTFQPARLGGKPVHSLFTVHIPIYRGSRAKVASKRFESVYRDLAKAIDAGDKAAADDEVTKLKPETLCEYALEGVVLYGYHLKWGTESQQRNDLRRALAFDPLSNLDKRTLLLAVQELIKLDLKRNDLSEALALWTMLRVAGWADEVRALKPAMDKAEALSKSDQPISLVAEITKGTSWIHLLPRRRFELAVHSGRLSGFKLRCETEFGVYRHQPGMTYMTGEEARRCKIEVTGEEGTRFDLIS